MEYEHIISIENLLAAWQEFLPGKRSRSDVQEFGAHLMDNIFALHNELIIQTYRHGPYHQFNISDPKPRCISKASVRDRLLHHAIHRSLYPFFAKRFIADSFSCQLGKGTHRALDRFRTFARKVSRNHTRTSWVLKCDIRKFFASIDQNVLLEILTSHIADERTLWLLQNIIRSFAPGLPLGNLTSQLLVNIYMNEFDQWAKHALKAKYYIRYADDFVFMSHDKSWLEELLLRVDTFLAGRLHLQLHPNKVSISTLASGVDFLGWVHFLDHRVMRRTTRRRMCSRLAQFPTDATRQSYLGLLKHGNTKTLRQMLIAGFDGGVGSI